MKYVIPQDIQLARMTLFACVASTSGYQDIPPSEMDASHIVIIGHHKIGHHKIEKKPSVGRTCRPQERRPQERNRNYFKNDDHKNETAITLKVTTTRQIDFPPFNTFTRTTPERHIFYRLSPRKHIHPWINTLKLLKRSGMPCSVGLTLMVNLLGSLRHVVML
jgi:hypothetical protein